MRSACLCVPPALAGLSNYFLDLPTQKFSTPVAFPLLSPLSSLQRLLRSVGGITSLSRPHRNGGLSSGLHGMSTTSAALPSYSPSLPSASTSPGSLPCTLVSLPASGFSSRPPRVDPAGFPRAVLMHRFDLVTPGLRCSQWLLVDHEIAYGCHLATSRPSPAWWCQSSHRAPFLGSPSSLPLPPSAH